MGTRVEKGVNHTVLAREEQSNSWGWQEICQGVVRNCLLVKGSRVLQGAPPPREPVILPRPWPKGKEMQKPLHPSIRAVATWPTRVEHPMITAACSLPRLPSTAITVSVIDMFGIPRGLLKISHSKPSPLFGRGTQRHRGMMMSFAQGYPVLQSQTPKLQTCFRAPSGWAIPKLPNISKHPSSWRFRTLERVPSYPT